jgi:integrase
LSLYKRSKSQFYWCRFEIRGREYRYSTEKIDRREAEAEERRLRVEAEQSAAPARRRGVGPLSDLAAADIERAIREGADADTSERTLTVHWTPLLTHLGKDRDIATIALSDVEGYVSARRVWPDQRNPRTLRRVRGQTIRRELAALRRAFKIAKKLGWVSSLPDFDAWPRLKKDPPSQALRGKLRSPELLRKLIAEAGDRRLQRANSNDAAVRDHLIFAVVTGLRWAELQRVTGGWVEDAPPDVGVPALVRLPEADTKTGEPRYLGLPQEGLEAVQRRRAAAPHTGGLLFPHKSLGQWLRRWSAAQTPPVSPAVTLRDLRHTYSTLGLEGSGDAAAVQGAMGHSDLRTTQLYQSSTVARVARVGVAVAASVFGARPKSKRKKKAGTPKPAQQDDDAAKPLILFSARLAQLDRATVSEADETALFLANFSFGQVEISQQKPSKCEVIPAHLAGTPTVPLQARVRVVEVVEGWVTANCLSCARAVEVYDQGCALELRCPLCELPLSREGVTYVA